MAQAGKLTALLSAARQHEDSASRDRALEELLRLLTIFIRAGMGESLRRHRESADICQSVAKSFVVDLFDGRLEFPTEAALVAYLQQIVRTKLAEAARRDRAIKRGGGVASVEGGLEGQIDAGGRGEATPSMHAIAGETRARVAAELDADDAELVRLKQSGMTWEQIGCRLGLSSAAVRQRWSRVSRRAAGGDGD